MPADDELLRQVLDAPDDDAPRLVLADRLLERGDARGELIQIQCALGRGVDQRGRSGPAPSGGDALFWVRFDRAFYEHLEPPHRADLEARERALLKKHGRTWLAPVLPFIEAWSWRRGFLAAVYARAVPFVDGAEVLLASHPTMVTLERLDEASATRLASAPLRGLRRLHVDGVNVRTFHAFTGENLADVETLLLTGAIGDVGVERLAHESHLRSVRRLALPHHAIGDAGVEAIAHSRVFENLEELYLDDNPITDEGVRRLVESPALPKLRFVSLDETELDEDLLEALAQRLTLPRPSILSDVAPSTSGTSA